MSTTISTAAPRVLQEYYRILAGGPDACGQGDDLRPLLSEHHPDATDGFLQGVAGFIGTVQHLQVVREVHDPSGSAVLHDATLPGGSGS